MAFIEHAYRHGGRNRSAAHIPRLPCRGETPAPRARRGRTAQAALLRAATAALCAACIAAAVPASASIVGPWVSMPLMHCGMDRYQLLVVVGEAHWKDGRGPYWSMAGPFVRHRIMEGASSLREAYEEAGGGIWPKEPDCVLTSDHSSPRGDWRVVHRIYRLAPDDLAASHRAHMDAGRKRADITLALPVRYEVVKGPHAHGGFVDWMRLPNPSELRKTHQLALERQHGR